MYRPEKRSRQQLEAIEGEQQSTENLVTNG